MTRDETACTPSLAVESGRLALPATGWQRRSSSGAACWRIIDPRRPVFEPSADRQ